MDSFEEDLKCLINVHSIENESDTPDHILAQYIMGCLKAYKKATRRRDNWYGYEPWSGLKIAKETNKG